MIVLDPILFQWILGLVGTALLTALGFILRTLGRQNEALAVLVARVNPAIENIQKTAALELAQAKTDSTVKTLVRDVQELRTAAIS